jgi:site-specific recombinase
MVSAAGMAAGIIKFRHVIAIIETSRILVERVAILSSSFICAVIALLKLYYLLLQALIESRKAPGICISGPFYFDFLPSQRDIAAINIHPSLSVNKTLLATVTSLRHAEHFRQTALINRVKVLV